MLGPGYRGRVSEGTNLDPFLTGVDSPMFVVTTACPDSGARAGCLVGFTTQCSIDPDLFVVCLSHNNHTYRVATRAEVLVVHGLDDAQRPLAELFGSTTGDEVDKFTACSWRPGPQGVPVLDDCPRWFAGRILDRTPWGNHSAFLLRPLEVGGHGRATSPMMLSHVKDLRPGHEA
jgi:flavin reductase (DIM6/NTAB) family NADH-FMN oxidoreductase RutF